MQSTDLLGHRAVLRFAAAVITDAAVAALMARAAVRSAVYNVKINLNLISDQDYCSVLVERIAALEQEALSAEKNILEHTDKVLS
jgi:formiminotetrahydrofolate cyclodeaminase